LATLCEVAAFRKLLVHCPLTRGIGVL
jgi:hypothetical protein